jgi:hypothetical protein
MRCIHTRAPAHNPRTVAYIDTVEVFFPGHKLTGHAHVLLTKIGCRRCRTTHQWGYRYKLNYPFDAATLVKLDWITERYQGTLTRFDPALDIQASDRDYLLNWIKQHALLRWRRPGEMDDWKQGTCWIPITLNPPRNLLVYIGRPNKVTKDTQCVHVELRFITAASVRRQGIRRVRDLLNLDPAKLFAKHLKWSNIGALHVIKTIRKAVKEDMQRQYKSEHQFLDKYRASIPVMVQGRLKRLQMDRSQQVKGRFRHRKVKEIVAPFEIPSKLTWKKRKQDMGSLKRQGILEKAGRCDTLTL